MMDDYRPLAIVVDDDGAFRRAVQALLGSIGFSSDANASVDSLLAVGKYSNVDLIVLDNRWIGSSGEKHSYWQDDLPRLRERHPNATILLVSELPGAELLDECKQFKETRAGRLLAVDPHVLYIPKGGDEETWRERVAGIARPLHRRLTNLRELQVRLVCAAVEAARALHDMPIQDLAKQDMAKDDEWKHDTIRADKKAEEILRDRFSPVMNTMSVVICTEEMGLHNTLHRRVPAPEFYVFSDPFDGSTRTKHFISSLSDSQKAKSFGAIVDQEETREKWWAEFVGGGRTLNSPFVSMVLAERHRVVGAVLVNLFTRDVYVSMDGGNYTKHFDSWPDQNDLSDQIWALAGRRSAQAATSPPGVSAGWRPIRFRTYGQLSSSKPDRRPQPLFLGQLWTAKWDEAESCRHIRQCVFPVLPPEYDFRESYRLRQQQADFTPGPARVLFLMDLPELREYEESSLRGKGNDQGVAHYECVVAGGEPITEWIGWFAFLRHAPGISAFCLRPRMTEPHKDLLGRSACHHRSDQKDPAPMLPDEVESIFREGYMDLAVLHAAYGGAMKRYKDTFVVMFDDDDTWQRCLRDPMKPNEERFVRIPLMQPYE